MIPTTTGPVRRSSPEGGAAGAGSRAREIQLLNYKDVGTLSRFLTESGKILPRRTTKVTSGFQRQLGRSIKRARYLALSTVHSGPRGLGLHVWDRRRRPREDGCGLLGLMVATGSSLS